VTVAFLSYYLWMCTMMPLGAFGFLARIDNNNNNDIARCSIFSNNKNECLRMATSTCISSTSPSKSGGRVINNLQNFEKQVLTKDGSEYEIVMVFYTAPWCGPCRLSNPVVKEIIQLFKGKMDIVEIDTDDLPEVPELAGVVSIPTIQLYHQGQLKETIVGCVAKNVLEKALNKLFDEISPPQ